MLLNRVGNTYLEDYLENISTLPMDLTRKFQLMQDLDKRTLDMVTQVEQETRAYIGTLRKKRSHSTAFAGGANTNNNKNSSSSSSSSDTLASVREEDNFKKIRRDLQECVTLGDEKVALATQTYEMVDKHIRRLDEDLKAFAAELCLNEAAENNPDGAPIDANNDPEKLAKMADELIRDTRERVKRDKLDAQITARMRRGKLEDKTAKKKQKQKQKQHAQQQQHAQLQAQVAQHVIPGVQGSAIIPGMLPGHHSQIITGSSHAHIAGAAIAGEPRMRTGLDLEIDPNEPTYCTCGRVSFGEMIGCDSPNCKIEWYHLSCVGLSAPPKGKWYCDDCRGKK